MAQTYYDRAKNLADLGDYGQASVCIAVELIQAVNANDPTRIKTAQQLAGHETRAAEYWHLASWYGPDGKTKRVIHSGEKEWALELFVLQHIPVASPRAQDVLIKDTKHIPAFAQVCAILAEGMKKAQLIVPDLSTWSQTKSMPDGVLQTLRDQEYIAPHNKSYVDGLSLTPKGENLINAYKQRGTLQLYALIHLDS